MPSVRLWKRIISALIVFTELLLFPLAAAAETPSDAPEKGSDPAVDVSLPESWRTVPSDYDAVPVEVEKVMIGLDYGDDAPYEVYLYNASGKSFQIGSYDGNRVFQAEAELPSRLLLIRPVRKWHLLFDECFSSREEAVNFASQSHGTAVEIDGAYRVIYGSFDTAAEIQYLIRNYAFRGSPWQDSALGVYDEWYTLLFLSDKSEIAFEPVSEGKGVTAYNGEEYYGGFLLKQTDGDRFTVINVVPLEDYVKGVVPYEMSPSWPIEALKAQAVCARSYAAYNLHAFEKYGFDLTDDTESQVYRGVLGADTLTDAAVDATAGEYVRWRGQLCEVYYFASDGGATEDGGKIFSADYPYLAGKMDPFEQAVDFSVIKWELWRDGTDVATRLQSKGYDIGMVVHIVPEYSELGNVVAMNYYDDAGTCLHLENRESYIPLALSSARFTVEAKGDGFLFSGRGWGHNCGMSQWGANAMAGVYGYDYQDIIKFYFTGAYVG